ncbi:MAG: polyprenyl synthetase family protein [Blautia sp.]|nr:polyprenyl synthetase family protein [Blautia sp.]
MNFQNELEQRTQKALKVIEHYLPAEEGFASELAAAMNYSMLAGGKRLRPVMLMASYELCGGTERVHEPFMAAIEMIHTHSLIHDDLPALDNDDYRRGRLTTHKVYGEAMGVLSGDALLNYAYETMLRSFSMTAYPDRAARAMQVMAEKTGIGGMLGGQSVDVMNDGKPLSRDMLDYIYRNKTSALIEAPLMAGAILAGADDKIAERFRAAGTAVGLAFQIRDDILDVTGDAGEIGKPVHSDEKNHKVTYVSLVGLEKADEEVRRLSVEAAALIRQTEGDSRFLEALILELTSRNK